MLARPQAATCARASRPLRCARALACVHDRLSSQPAHPKGTQAARDFESAPGPAGARAEGLRRPGLDMDHIRAPLLLKAKCLLTSMTLSSFMTTDHR